MAKIKASDLFTKYIASWRDVENGLLQNEIRIEMKDPENEHEFDEICYDSDDQDF